jgi:hypothetical protein
VQLSVDHLVLIDVEPLEERLVQESTLGVGGRR